MAKSADLSITGRLKRDGFRRGSYEVDARDIFKLKKDEYVETNLFEIGGFRWKVALLRGFRNSHPPEMLRIYLLSCNDVGVHADVQLDIFSREQMRERQIARKTKTAIPLYFIDKLEILFDKLGDQCDQDHRKGSNELVVSVDLKNVRIATEEEQRPYKISSRTITLEIITNDSIKQLLNTDPTVGVVPSNRHRHSDVSSRSLVRQWANSWPDHRYWLCERCADGNVCVRRCLNKAGLFESFENICVQADGGRSWVTLFREEKGSNEDFRPIDDNTSIVFCMFHEPSHHDKSYLGHLLARKTMRFYELSAKIADEMAGVSDGKYQVFLQNGQSQTNLNAHQSTLGECGIFSGSVLIVKPEFSRIDTGFDKFTDQPSFASDDEVIDWEDKDSTGSECSPSFDLRRNFARENQRIAFAASPLDSGPVTITMHNPDHEVCKKPSGRSDAKERHVQQQAPRSNTSKADPKVCWNEFDFKTVNHIQESSECQTAASEDHIKQPQTQRSVYKGTQTPVSRSDVETRLPKAMRQQSQMTKANVPGHYATSEINPQVVSIREHVVTSRSKDIPMISHAETKQDRAKTSFLLSCER